MFQVHQASLMTHTCGISLICQGEVLAKGNESWVTGPVAAFLLPLINTTIIYHICSHIDLKVSSLPSKKFCR